MKETKKEKRGFRNGKGITLIALVVTIVILLILATVTILALTGDQGLFAKAREARTSTQNKSEEEQVKLEVMASWDENGNLLAGTVRTNLRHIQDASVDGGTGFPVTVTFAKTNNSYQVLADGTVTATTSGGGGGDTITAGQRATGGNKTYSDGTSNTNNTAVIPEGFTVSNISTEKTVESGLVVYDIPADKVEGIDWTNGVDGEGNNLQETYNQFVWVPVPNFSEFVRHDFGNQNITDDYFINTELTSGKYYEPTPNSTNGTTSTTAAEVTNMYNSVEENGGFYIARYEAGRRKWYS